MKPSYPHDGSFKSLGKILGFLIGLTVGCFLCGSTANAQALRINGGDITMNITAGTVSGLIPVANSTTSLRYRRSVDIQKITVRTNCPGQNFDLSVVASNATSGTPAPAVDLVHGMLDTDIITTIPWTSSNFSTATLNYQASATFAQGNSTELGNDVHSVTYTLTAQ